jgi:hypothetical protein
VIRLSLQMILIFLIAAWLTFEGRLATGFTARPSEELASVGGSLGSTTRPTGLSASPTDPAQPKSYPQTLVRPIFFQGRRFLTPQAKPTQIVASAEPVAAAMIVPAPDKIKFRGVLMIAGTKKALLEGPASGIIWLAPGELIEGWTVSAIDRNAVTLKNGTATASIALYPEKP